MADNAVRRFLKSVLRGDRRRAARYPLEGAGGLASGAEARAVTLHDLSLTGALVDGKALPPAGATVTLTADSLEARAIVVWSDGGKAGLRFERPLSVEQLFTIVHRAHFHPGAGIPASLAA